MLSQSIREQIETIIKPIKFIASNQFYWSPESNEIYYDKNSLDHVGVWSLLHESGHALLGHSYYSNDFHLLSLEIAAWQKAKELANKLNLAIDQNHIEDCLDTYRDWIDKRSICPVCNIRSLQNDNFTNYNCFNCHSKWRVTPSRFCRPYRSVIY